MILTEENMLSPVEKAFENDNALSPLKQAIDTEAHTEYEQFYNSKYGFNIEVPKGMNDNDYSDYCFRLNNGLTPEERVKYYDEDIPYGDGMSIANRQKENNDGFWHELKPSLANAALYASTGFVKGLYTAGTSIGTSIAAENAFNEEYNQRHKDDILFDRENHEKEKEEWMSKNKAEQVKSEAAQEAINDSDFMQTIKNAEFELTPQKRFSAGWWGQGIGNVAAPLGIGLSGGIIPQMAVSYGFGNYSDTVEKVLEGGGSLKEANARGAISGSLEALFERFAINKYATKVGMPRLQRYFARFGTGMVQEGGQSAKDIIIQGKYDDRTDEEKEEDIIVSLIFGGLGEIAGLGARDIGTRKVRKDISASAQKEGMSKELAKEVALSATVDEKPNFDRLQKMYAEEAESRFNARKAEAYEKLIKAGNTPERAAEKVNAAMGDFQTEYSQVIEDLQQGTYMTQEEKDKHLSDYEDAVNKGGEDADKLLQVREMITDYAKQKNLSEDEYLPTAKINSMVALKTWKIYNENNGMSWEEFINDKGVADVILQDSITDEAPSRTMQYSDGLPLKQAPEGANSPEQEAWINAQVDKQIAKKNVDNATENAIIEEGVQNNEKYEATDEFRKLQEESRGLSSEDIKAFHDGSKQIDDGLRGRFSDVLERELEARNSRLRYGSRVLSNPKTNQDVKFYSDVDANTFYDVFDMVHKYLPKGDAVDVHAAEDYQNNKNYLSSDGMSGFSITPSGDLISVFSLGKSGFLRTIQPVIKQEAKTLDCFDSAAQHLPEMYQKTLGFKTAAVLDFNYDILAEYNGKEYADYFVKTYGEAPVHFMVNTDKEVETKHFNKDQYDEAVAYQQEQAGTKGGKLFSRTGYASMRKPLEGNALSTSHYGEGEGGTMTHGYGNYVLFDKDTNKAYYFDPFFREGNAIKYKGQDLSKGVHPRHIQRIYNKLYGKNKIDKEAIKESLDYDENWLKNHIKEKKEQYARVVEQMGEDLSDERKKELDVFIKEHDEGRLGYSDMVDKGKNHLEAQYLLAFYDLRQNETFLQEVRDAKKLNLDDFEISGLAQQWEVETPDEYEMLQEDEVLTDQDPEIVKALEKINKEGPAKGFLDTLRTYHKDNDIDGYDVYNKIAEYAGSKKAASELLLKHGVKGIEYYGGRDGHGAVIFGDAPVQNRLLSRNQGAYTPISRIIEIAKEHTPDTFLHEVSHNFFINYFDAIERIADKNSEYYKQAQPLYDYIGKSSSAEFTDRDWERITESFVKYVHTGNAPSESMKTVFDRAKNWTINIFHTIEEEKTVSPEIKEFFDGLVTEESNLTGISELHDRMSDVIRIIHGAKTGKEALVGGKDKQDIDLLLSALNARQPRKGKTLAQELRQDGGINADSELAKTLGYDPKKKNQIFKKNGRFESIDEIEDYLREKGIYNFKDAETAEEVAKKEDDIIDIIQNADMTYSQSERYQEDLRDVVARNQAEAQKVLGEIMDREGLSNLNEVENLLLKARKQMNTVGKDIIAVNKNAIKYIQDSMFRAKRELGRIMKESDNTRYNYQQKLKDIIRNLPISYKNKEKLMGNIARVTNKETFDKVASQVMERAEDYAKQEEKNLHRENIRTLLSGTYQRGKNKKFTYEGNQLFEELRNINKMTQEQAENELFKRLEETAKSDVKDGGLSQSEILTRRMLEYKAQGADTSLDNVAQLDFDINSVIVDDLKTREEFDAAKSAKIQEDINYLIDKMDNLPASKKPLLLLSIKNGDFYSMMNEIGGKEFADKYNMRIPFAEQELYLQKRLADAISQGAKIYGVTTNKFMDVVQELSDPRYTITPNDNYGSDKISKMEIMHIWLGMRQPDTRDLILKNYEQFDDNGVQLTNQIDNLISNLELKDIQFAGMLQREMNKDYDEENKAYVFRNGVDMPRHENYFPRTSRRGGINEDSVDAYANLALQVPSFYKARGKNAIPVFKNVWTVFKQHKADASYAINVFPKYLDVYKILNDSKVKHLIESKYGKAVAGDIRSMVTAMGASNYTGIYSSMNQTISKLAGNWIKAKIGVNPAIFAKQLISVTNYAENMPVTDYVKNMSYALRHPKEAYDFMQDVAGDFITTRFKLGRQNEVLSRQMATDEDTKKGLIKSSVSQNIDDVITFAVRTGDIAPIVYGGYSRVKYLIEKEGKSKEEARQIFIDETWRSQQASAAPTTSNFQKQGGVSKFITAFQNTPMQYARILAEAQTMHNRGDITDKQYYKTLANYMIVQPFLLAVISNGFYNLLHDDDKDKDVITLSDTMKGAATSWLGGVPMLTDIFNNYWLVAQGEKPYDLNIGILADISKSSKKLLKKDKDTWDWVEAVTPLIESVTGKPIGVVERYSKKIFD